MKHLPLLVRATAAASILLLVAGCSSKADRIESGLRKGAQFVKTADWDKANIEARNVLQIDPKNAPAYLLGAKVAEGQRDVQRAYANYLKAVELAPDLREAKVGLARIYLLADESAKARSQVDDVLQADAHDTGALTIKAALAARGGDVPGALAQAKAIVASAKTVPVDASMLLAGLYMNDGDHQRALQAVDAGLKAEPGNLSLLQVGAQIAGHAAAPPEVAQRAPEYLRDAVQQAPKDSELWNAWAGHHIRKGELDAAEAVLRDAAKKAPDDSRRTLNLIDFLANRQGIDAAERELRAAIDKRSKDTELRVGLANLLRSSGRDLDAQQVFKDIIAQAPEAPAALAAKSELASYKLLAAQNAEARELIEAVLKVNPRDSRALVLRGRLALREGNARGAIADLRAAARDQPGSPEVVGLLARAHIVEGEPALAREVLTDAVKFKPDDVSLRLLLAAQLSDEKNLKDALGEIDAALKVQPLMPRLYEAKAQLLAAQKDMAGAERVLQELRSRLPQQTIGHLRLGQFYSEHKRLDAALKVFDAGAAQVRNDPTLALAAVGVLTAQQKYAEIDARMDALAKAEPRNPLPYQVRGDVAMARRNIAAAEAAYRRMIEVAPNVPAGYLGLARAHAARNDTAAALAALQQGEAANPAAHALTSARAELLHRAGRQDEAVKAYESVLAKAPNDEAANNNLAYLLAESDDKAGLERALKLIGRFAESRNPSYLDSLGWVHYRLGNFAAALPLLERAVALQPNAPLLSTHLGMALVKGGDKPRGQQMLRKVLEARANVPHQDEMRALAGLN